MEANKLRIADLLHGADYNPEQWLDRPDILARDIELMKEAHCNVVSMGMFSWSMLEPEEGNYQFEWLESVINNLYNNGIYTFLSTPSGARPHWLAKKYPEKTVAQQPQPLPPECVSCFSLSKIKTPQSL